MFDKDSLESALGELGVADPGGIFEELAAAYGESGRHYHSARHIDECLRQFQSYRQLAAHPPEIEVAIWFHDVVYDTRRGDNEERSADWARSYLSARGADAAAVERIARMILATKTHAGLTSLDEQLMVDIDLGILGQPPAAFERYDQAIRQEYAWVPEEPYRLGRAAIMRGFLERDSIYSTDLFRSRYERQARDNIARKLQMLDT